MKSSNPSPSTPTPLTRALAILGSCLTIFGVVCLLKNGHLGTMTLWIGLSSIALALPIIGVALWLEYRRAPGSFSGLITPRASAAYLFDDLSSWPLPSEGRALIAIDETYAKRLRQGVWLAYGIALMSFAAALSIGAGPGAAHMTKSGMLAHRLINLELGFAAVMLLSCVIAIALFTRKRLRSRIGIEAAGILFDDGDGRLQRHDWNSVLTDRQSLLVGRHTIRLMPDVWRPSVGRFPRDPLRGYVLARLPASSYVSRYRLAWAALCRSSLTTRIWYGGAIAAFLAAEYLKLHPKLAAPVHQAIIAWLAR
jgi:hypothetical protein